jgi:hypothetical protein
LFPEPDEAELVDRDGGVSFVGLDSEEAALGGNLGGLVVCLLFTDSSVEPEPELGSAVINGRFGKPNFTGSSADLVGLVSGLSSFSCVLPSGRGRIVSLSGVIPAAREDTVGSIGRPMTRELLVFVPIPAKPSLAH